MNLFTSKSFLIIFCTILILKSVTVWSSNLDKIKIIQSEISLKNIAFIDYKGNSAEVIDEKTEYYILNFWASWCAPCIKEMRSFSELKKIHSKIKIITVSQDADIEDAKSFFDKNPYENLGKYYDFEKNVSKNFSLRGLPTTFIFNKKLKAFAKVEGIIEWDSKDFIEWLNKKK